MNFKEKLKLKIIRIDEMIEACEEAGLCGNSDIDGDGIITDVDNCPNDAILKQYTYNVICNA